MPLEIAQYISDLVASNPPTSDIETQGANHLQLIKTVLQNVFGTSSRRFVGLPNMSAQSLSIFNASPANANLTFLMNTSGGPCTFNLPTLLSTDAGWEISIVKTTTDLNPIFIVPPSGTIQSGETANLVKCRRCIPGRRTRVFWTGFTFIAERVESRPIGTIFDISGNVLPVGYEWANGQILSSSANYPEYNAVVGSLNTADMRGRASFGLDNVGGAGTAGRITVAGGNFDGTVIFNAGGLEKHNIAQAELPAVAPTFTGNQVNLGTLNGNQQVKGTIGVGGTAFGGGSVDFQNITPTVTIPPFTPSGSITPLGSGNSMTILSPAIILGKVLVVE